MAKLHFFTVFFCRLITRYNNCCEGSVADKIRIILVFLNVKRLYLSERTGFAKLLTILIQTKDILEIFHRPHTFIHQIIILKIRSV